jgi:hypothetical protein
MSIDQENRLTPHPHSKVILNNSLLSIAYSKRSGCEKLVDVFSMVSMLNINRGLRKSKGRGSAAC